MTLAFHLQTQIPIISNKTFCFKDERNSLLSLVTYNLIVLRIGGIFSFLKQFRGFLTF